MTLNEKYKMGKEQMQKNGYRCAVFVAAILLIVQVALLGSFLVDNQLNENKNITASIMQRQIASDEGMVQNIVGFGATIASNKDIIRLLEQDDNEIDDWATIGATLRQYKYILPYVDDIYLYKNSSKLIYDTYLNVTPLENFEDSATAAELEKENSIRRKSVINIPKNDGSRKDAGIAYLFSENKREKNVVVLNVNYNKLSEAYATMQINLEQQVVVTNESGEVLYGGQSFSIGKNISKEELFKKRNTKGLNQIYKYNGEKKIVNYFYSEQCGRWYISVADYNKVVLKALFDKRIMMCILLLLVFVSCLTHLLKHMKKIKYELETGMEHMKVTWNNNSKSEERQAMLFEYMKSECLNYDDELRKCLPLGFNAERIGVVCIDIDSFVGETDGLSQKDMDLYRYAVNNICSEIINNYAYCCKCFDENRKIIYIIGNIDDVSYAKLHNKIAAECMKNVFESFQTKVSVYISRLYSLQNINDGYAEMTNISQYKFVYGENVVIDWNAIHEPDTVQRRECMQICRSIGDLMLENHGECLELFDEMVNKLYDMNIADVKEVLLYLQVFMQTAVDILQQRKKLYSDFRPDKLELMKKANNLPEIIDIFHEFVNELHNDVENTFKDKQDVIENAIAVIKKEYTNEALCVADVAERIGLSPSYLGKLFKRGKGISVADCINNVRLEEAERLLCQTNKKINEIMECIGFTNSSYFAVLFKKKYGSTPSVYRKINRLEEK